MKIFRLLIIIMLLFPWLTCSCQVTKNKVIVTGKVTFTALYKGGARPTPEVLEVCCQTHPLTNTKLFLKKNYYGPVKCVITTDNAGNFKKRLRPGIYSVFLRNELDETKAKEIASGKINQDNVWRTEPFFVMDVVPGKNLSFVIDIRERTDPKEPMRR